MANPVPPPPLPPPAVSLDATAVVSAVPPHEIDGVEITIQDLMVTESEGVMKDKDLSEWLDEREKLGFQKMAETKATGRADIDESTVRTLAQKYREDNDKVKCRGNAITRSCAFTGAFVILEDGRRVLYPECPGEVRVHVDEIGLTGWVMGVMVASWCGDVVVWWQGGKVTWWQGGVVARWHGGGKVVWWCGGKVAWWQDGVVARWQGGKVVVIR